MVRRRMLVFQQRWILRGEAALTEMGKAVLMRVFQLLPVLSTSSFSSVPDSDCSQVREGLTLIVEIGRNGFYSLLLIRRTVRDRIDWRESFMLNLKRGY
jgi:hypothetical protein